MKYSTDGKEMPNNVISSLTYIAKVGFITREIWNDFFGNGNIRWKQRQFKKMIEEDLIVPFANTKISNVFVLSRKGKSLLLKTNLGCSVPPYSAVVEHDEVIARSLLNLERKKIVTEWNPECELKRTNALQFDIGVSAKEQKYPDAIFKISLSGKTGIFALEYERSLKSASRYKDILWLYSKASNIDVVIFVCKDKLIENTIRGRLNFLRNLTLFKKVGFVDAHEWIKGPETATIHFHSVSNTLENLCLKIEKNYANDVAAKVAA